MKEMIRLKKKKKEKQYSKKMNSVKLHTIPQ